MFWIAMKVILNWIALPIQVISVSVDSQSLCILLALWGNTRKYTGNMSFVVLDQRVLEGVSALEYQFCHIHEAPEVYFERIGT